MLILETKSDFYKGIKFENWWYWGLGFYKYTFWQQFLKSFIIAILMRNTRANSGLHNFSIEVVEENIPNRLMYHYELYNRNIFIWSAKNGAVFDNGDFIYIWNL